MSKNEAINSLKNGTLKDSNIKNHKNLFSHIKSGQRNYNV